MTVWYYTHAPCVNMDLKRLVCRHCATPCVQLLVHCLFAVRLSLGTDASLSVCQQRRGESKCRRHFAVFVRRTVLASSTVNYSAATPKRSRYSSAKKHTLLHLHGELRQLQPFLVIIISDKAATRKHSLLVLLSSVCMKEHRLSGLFRGFLQLLDQWINKPQSQPNLNNPLKLNHSLCSWSLPEGGHSLIVLSDVCSW